MSGGLKTVAETRFEGRRDDMRERRDIIRSDEAEIILGTLASLQAALAVDAGH